MKVAHVRERHAPAGSPWRLAAALDAGDAPARWLDLETARRRLVAADARRAHNDPLFRRAVTTLDEHLSAGLRVADLRPLVDGFEPRAADDDAVLHMDDLAFGSPVLNPPTVRDFYAFEVHVATMWHRRGGEVPEAWYRLPVFYFSNPSGIRGPAEPVWAPRGSMELDYELEVAALIDVRARDLPAADAESVIGGFTVFNDWSARDLQRDETAVRLGPAKGKDFASTFGPWLVTPDELEARRTPTGYDVEMAATVNGRETSRGRWSDAQFSFAQMLERASADVTLRPGDLVGSGTVGTGCLLEVRESTLGRYLEPGDEVTLTVVGIGSLRSSVIARPDASP